MASRARVFLGRTGVSLSSRTTVYRTPEAIETDEAEGYDVTRRRVRFEDVLLLTYHRRIAAAAALLVVLFLTFATFIGLIWLSQERSVAVGVYFLVVVAPLAVLLALQLILRLDVITVYGPYTRAEVAFWLRKGKARRTYQEIARLVREKQRRAAPPRRTMPPPPPVSPPPPPPLTA
jgi:hypothetical protein